jgi:uncharacterized protein
VHRAGSRSTRAQESNLCRQSRRGSARAHEVQAVVRSGYQPMPQRPRYLIVDGHSIIFAWPELRKLHQQRFSLGREALIKQLRDYQDWTGIQVVVVFDGKAPKTTATSDPGDVQIFYSRSGQAADAVIERLASKYANRFQLTVATSDSLEAETVQACGAEWISPHALRELLKQARA